MHILAGWQNHVAQDAFVRRRLATRRGADEGVRPYVICASLGEGADALILILIITVLCTMLLLLPPGSGSYSGN
jgi:hypothetical protein